MLLASELFTLSGWLLEAYLSGRDDILVKVATLLEVVDDWAEVLAVEIEDKGLEAYFFNDLVLSVFFTDLISCTKQSGKRFISRDKSQFNKEQ